MGPFLRRRLLAFILGLAACFAIPSTADAYTVLARGSHPLVRGRHAILIGNKAYAPSRAPDQVKQVIWSANQIRHKPYKWGGGHGSWYDDGYDCSGAVSYALHGAGLLDYPLDSRGFMQWGDPGRGRWIDVWATNGHAYMVVAGLRFDTAGAGESGPRWRPEPAWEQHYWVRHPPGL
ncbi:MAG: hypothetical protein JOZ25_01045 [Actinobacteria bacterium]|nr:hypothetical protein [Actinomycetota bacterium]